MAKINLGALLAAIVGDYAGFKAPNNIGNMLTDVSLSTQVFKEVAPGANVGADLHQVAVAAAGLAAIKNGQVAIVGTAPASFDGHADRVVTLLVRQYAGSTPPPGSPASVLKSALGY